MASRQTAAAAAGRYCCRRPAYRAPASAGETTWTARRRALRFRRSRLRHELRANLAGEVARPFGVPTRRPKIAKRHVLFIGPCTSKLDHGEPSFQFDRCRPSRPWPVAQRIRAHPSAKSLLPTAHGSCGTAYKSRDILDIVSIRRQKCDLRAPNFGCAPGCASRNFLKFGTNLGRQTNGQRRWSGFLHARRIARDPWPVDPCRNFGFCVLGFGASDHRAPAAKIAR